MSATQRARPSVQPPITGEERIFQPRVIPEKGENNVWFANPDAETVFVFVHGIFSESRGCWLDDGGGYWPKIVSEDEQFSGVGIFLAGYWTDVQTGPFGLQDCAHEIFQNLMTPVAPAKTSIMKGAKTIVFIGHSTGGIVVRQLLSSNTVSFCEKNIGVVLMASPSTGSYYADKFSRLAAIYKNKLGQTLQRDDVLLDSLDRQFGIMVSRSLRHIPAMTGVEACETQMVFRKKVLGGLDRFIPRWLNHLIVDENSAARYWRPATKIPHADHFSIVKPTSAKHASHVVLRDFWQFFLEFTASPRGKPQPEEAPNNLPAETELGLIGRTFLTKRATRELLEGGHVTLHGTRKVGKTAIALHVANRKEVQEKYDAGVLWADMAENSLFDVLYDWGLVLGMTKAAMSALTHVEERERAVSVRLQRPGFLLVLDGSVNETDVRLFQQLSMYAVVLLVRPSTPLAEGPVLGMDLEVGPLTPEDIEAILTRTSPKLLFAYRDLMLEFGRRFEALPGTLIAAARMLVTMPTDKAVEYLKANQELNP